MTPSVNQRGNDNQNYETEPDRICAEWGEEALKMLYPTGEDLARTYLGMAYKHNRNQRIINHFANRVREEKD